MIEITLIKDMVDRLDPSIAGKEGDPGYRAAVVLLAAVAVDPVLDKLIETDWLRAQFHQ